MKNIENTIIQEMDNNEKNQKKTYVVPICLLLIVVLLFGILFKLHETNKYLKILSNLYNDGKLNIVIPTDNYESVSDVFQKNESEYNSNNELESIPSANEDTSENNNEIIDDGNSKSTYVLNTSSKKIHNPSCSHAERMNEENKKIIELSNEQLEDYIQNGYTKCSTCGG